jgi:hypothetical protein
MVYGLDATFLVAAHVQLEKAIFISCASATGKISIAPRI